MINQQLQTKSAIHLMVKNVPVAEPDDTIGSIEKNLIDNSKNFETIDYIYILDKQKLAGVISVREIFALPKDTVIKDIMITDIVSVHPHSHREHAAQLALKHNIKAVPVLDKESNFLGVIPSDIILKVAHDEITEDLLLLEGIHIKQFSSISTLKNTAFSLLGKRLPWLLMGLVGGLIAANIIGFFEELLAEEILLISFLPLMVYMSDAVGSQSQTIYIRSLALESKANIWNYLVKEIIVSTMIAFCLGVLLLLFVTIFHRFHLGVILSVSLFFTVVSSVIVAIIIPWILTKFHKDPAVGSGPFATIIRDILSILIYFGVSQLLLAS